MNKQSPKLIIKNKPLTFLDVFIPVVFSCIGVMLILADTTILLVFSILLFLFPVFRIIQTAKRITDKEPKIVIDKNGIDFIFDQSKYQWEEIENVSVEKHYEGWGRSRGYVYYLHLQVNNQELTCSLKDYKLNIHMLKKIIKYYDIQNPSSGNTEI